MTESHSITIAIITFRRPESLARTLDSLKHIHIPPHTSLHLRIIDNDAAKSAHATVAACQTTMPFPVEYVLEDRRGIPHARNRALLCARQDDYIAFIDDDDTADPGWIVALYHAIQATGAEVVAGQLQYVFPPGKDYLGTIDVFTTPQAQTGSDLQSAWSGNVLFSTQIYRNTGLVFDGDFLHTGGSDHHFFRTAKQNGARIIMCREAIVHVPVPLERTTWIWLTKRNLRIGATLTWSDIKTGGVSYALKQVIYSCMDSAKYFWRLMRGVIAGHIRLIHPGMVVFFILGRIAGICHVSPREYQ